MDVIGVIHRLHEIGPVRKYLPQKQRVQPGSDRQTGGDRLSPVKLEPGFKIETHEGKRKTQAVDQAGAEEQAHGGGFGHPAIGGRAHHGVQRCDHDGTPAVHGQRRVRDAARLAEHHRHGQHRVQNHGHEQQISHKAAPSRYSTGNLPDSISFYDVPA